MAGSIADLNGIVQTAKLLREGLEENYTRIRHREFHRVFYPLLIDTSGKTDLTPIVGLAHNPMSQIIVTDDNGVEVYRVPPLWNTRNLNRVATSRRDSISAIVDSAAQRANSGTIPPSKADSFIIESFQHLVNHVEVSDEDRDAWKVVLEYNQSPDISIGQNQPTVKVRDVERLQFDGDYEDL